MVGKGAPVAGDAIQGSRDFLRAGQGGDARVSQLQQQPSQFVSALLGIAAHRVHRAIGHAAIQHDDRHLLFAQKCYRLG